MVIKLDKLEEHHTLPNNIIHIILMLWSITNMKELSPKLPNHKLHQIGSIRVRQGIIKNITETSHDQRPFA